MSAGQENKNRRDFLKTAGGVAAGLAVGGAAGWLSRSPEIVTTPSSAVTSTVTVTAPAPAPEVLKIGFIEIMSGADSAMGQRATEGATVALEDINGSGGIVDGVTGKRYTIDIVWGDGGCDATTGLSSLRKMIDIDKIKFFGGPPCSSAAVPMASVCDSEKIVMFSPSATSPKLKEFPNTFKLFPMQDVVDRAFAKAVFNDGNGHIVIIYQTDEVGSFLGPDVKKNFEEAGGTVDAMFGVEPLSTDYRTVITKILAMPDPKPAVFHSIIEAAMNLFYKQAYELGLAGHPESPPIYGTGAYPAAIAANPEATEGSYFFLPAYSNETWQYLRFSELFKKRWPNALEGEVLLEEVRSAHDVITGFKLAVEKGGYTYDGMVNALHGMAWQGVAYPIQLDDKGTNQRCAMDEMIAKNGKLVFVKHAPL
jgi:ABC-type branched-subunit amino acid transport system substrate-binding protein